MFYNCRVGGGKSTSGGKSPIASPEEMATAIALEPSSLEREKSKTRLKDNQFFTEKSGRGKSTKSIWGI